MPRRYEHERAGIEHVRQRTGIVLRVGWNFSKGHMTGRAHEIPELAIGHRHSVDPKGVHADAMRRSLFRIVLVRAHAKGAAGNPDHLLGKCAGRASACLLRDGGHGRSLRNRHPRFRDALAGTACDGQSINAWGTLAGEIAAKSWTMVQHLSEPWFSFADRLCAGRGCLQDIGIRLASGGRGGRRHENYCVPLSDGRRSAKSGLHQPAIFGCRGDRSKLLVWAQKGAAGLGKPAAHDPGLWGGEGECDRASRIVDRACRPRYSTAISIRQDNTLLVVTLKMDHGPTYGPAERWPRLASMWAKATIEGHRT